MIATRGRSSSTVPSARSRWCRAGAGRVRATVRFPQVTALPEILARIRRIFDLAADPLAIAAQLAEDPVMAPLVAARPGLRVPGAWDGFELAVRAILGQQITVAAATRLPASSSPPTARRSRSSW